jgi:hypothetical protein
MPKSSGQPLKVVRASPLPSPTSRPIKRFEQPAPGPHHQPVQHPPIQASNEIARRAVKIASDHNRSIDPRQMPDPNNLD